MKRILSALLSLVLFLTGCTSSNTTAQKHGYTQISQEEAKQMMDQLEDVAILDVREQDEFDSGHIPGAILLPVGTIAEDSAAAETAVKQHLMHL